MTRRPARPGPAHAGAGRWCWPAGCPTSATCRCAPGAGSPRRCARRASRSTVRDVDADLLPAAARGRRPTAWCRCCTARPARTARCARSSSCSGVPYVGSPARRPAGRRSTSRSPRPSSPGPGSAHPGRASTLPHETFRELGAAAVMDAIVASTRPAADREARPRRLRAGLHGRSVTPPTLPGAMVNAFAYGDTALVERFVEGAEVAVPVVDTGDGPARAAGRVDRARRRGLRLHRPLHRRQHGVRRCPAKLADELAAECARVAVAAHEALGPARPVPLRPDRRRRGHGVVPRGERRPRADRDLHGAAVGDAPRASTSATWSPIWYAALVDRQH